MSTFIKTEIVGVIDFDHLAKVVGKREDQVDVLKYFHKESTSDIADMNSALLVEEVISLSKVAHRMKGACGMVGANEMQQICLNIELASKKSDLKIAEIGINQLIEYMALIEKLIKG